jgi:DNA adenine methylase
MLQGAYNRASEHIKDSLVSDDDIRERVEFVCRCLQNRAGARVLLATLLAKIHNPLVDIRKPYTEIGGSDTYSGRRYDETYVAAFVNQYQLPCNSTTAFLTPAFRNRNATLTPDLNMVGRPARMYRDLLQLLTDVQEGRVAPDILLAETIRYLLIVRDEKRLRMGTLLAGLQSTDDAPPLSVAQIMTLLEQHLKTRGASRLPVLIVAAAYKSASSKLGEQVLPLEQHNAADEQTGSLGDLEITLLDDNRVVTSYEMKLKRVKQEDIDRALQKIQNSQKRIDNYIFITTDIIEEPVIQYAASIYEKTGGIEVVVLDCLSFIRHFLHLFHRLRTVFLDTYQQLVLEEPDSAVSQPLKEAFLVLRQAAESGESASDDALVNDQ